jgi:Zn-dependent protease with chaperone function
MLTPDYQPLVARLEALSARDPNRYQLLVALVALLGFAMLGGSLLLSLALSAGIALLLLAGKGFALIKLAIVPLALAWSILKALFVRMDPPQGTWLRPGDAPELQSEIERLRVATGAPKLSGIVITDEFNASATSLPRVLGLFGHRHVLSLGLPMMQALGREQFLAVVAHEFGHFGGGHSKFAGWIYRVRMSWLRVRVSLDQHAGWIGAPLRKFFDWYAPYFGAYSFVLARQNEYQADAMSARVVGAPAAAQALVVTSLAGRRLQDDFWPSVWKRVRDELAPPSSLYASMQASLRETAEQDAARLAQALAAKSDIDDTHPSLAQRLQALGCAAEAQPADAETADHLLGALGEELKARLSREWAESVAQGWQAEHERLQEQRGRLRELATQGAELDAKGRSELACLRDELDEGNAIAQQLAEAVAQDPANAELNFRLGRRLLDEGDAAGIGAIEAAMHLDAAYDDAGLVRLHRWHSEQGDEAAVEQLVERGRKLGEVRELALRQRRAQSADDEFCAHGLTQAQLDDLDAALRKFGKAGKVWIARKVLAREDGSPHYVLAVTWKSLAWTGDGTLQKFVHALPLDGSWTAVESKNLGKSKQRFLAIADQIYPRRA